MNLTGELVRHRGMGLGRIEVQDTQRITVRFFSGEKETFPFPACFSGTLEPVDEFIRRELSAMSERTSAQGERRYRDEF